MLTRGLSLPALLAALAPAACTRLAADEGLAPSPNVVEAGCADPCPALSEQRCPGDGAVQVCSRVAGCLTWATVRACEAGASCCEEADVGAGTAPAPCGDGSAGADARVNVAGFETCTIAITCRPSTSDAGLCNGTWTLDGTGMLNCPDPSKPPVEVTAKDLTGFAGLITSDAVLRDVVDGYKCLLDEAGPQGDMSVVVVLRKDGRTSVREAMSCTLYWQPSLLDQVSLLDTKYCRTAP